MSLEPFPHIVDLNVADAVRHIARHAGGDLDETDGRLLAAGRHAYGGPLFNAALRTDRRAEPEGVVADAIEFFDARRHAFAIWVATPVDMDLAQAARDAGLNELKVAGAGLAMLLRVPPGPLAPPGETVLATVSNQAQAEDFARVAGEAFAAGGQPPEVAEIMFSNSRTLLVSDAVGVLAYRHGQAISCALLLSGRRSAGIYFVGTVAAARGHGFGEAVTRHAVRLAFRGGARCVVLCAVPRAVPLYERVGFVPVSRYSLYGRGNPLDAAPRSVSGDEPTRQA